MPIGPFGEILGTTGTLENVSKSAAQKYKSKVIAPRNPKLIKGEQPEFKIKPSQYMFQMSLNTEKKLSNMHTMNVPRKIKLLDMSETSHQKISSINIDEPMFQPFPSEMIFQNFEPFESFEIPLTLRNNDKVPRLVKVTQQDSPYFKIISPHDVGHKVGPGLPTTFVLQFTPEEKKDYYHELVCITERERFIVPVRAIGARAILDFPDDINFQPGPVKYVSSRTLLVRNVGNRDCKFSLSTEKPFTVTPENGTIPINDSLQITVEFNPAVAGDHEQSLVLHYDTGEDVHIGLYGAAQDANVRLDKNSIRIENTYISMANERTVTISNRSDVIAHFKWTKFATREEEDLQKIMFTEKLDDEKKTEEDRFLEECLVDPALRDKLSILSRTFTNRQRQVENDSLIFDDEVFKIEPVEGDIWPNSTAEISFVFKPREPQTYTRTIFCDVTGRESRLPLRIRGDGIGPSVQFSFDEMDIGNIFVNSQHIYEVVLANKGDIDAIFSLVPSNSVFGPCFQFNPSEGIVMPDGHQAIQITFSSIVLGDFNEEFCFQIDGSPNNLSLVFKGAVIGPTFHFDTPKLNFSSVSYGFVHSQTCTLNNTALVPMTYHLRVPGDGVGESICSTSEYDSNVSEAGSSAPPKEFEITPSSGTMQPQSHTEVKVDICSNTMKKYDLALVVDIEGVGDEVLTVPISAKCVVPPITVLTPILDYGRCFLRHPYEHHVRLQNDTDLPAKYELVPQHVDEFTSILYTSPQPKGIIESHSVMEVPLVITPQGLEELEITCFFTIFGSPDPPMPVHIGCIGEGPVVHIMPMSMDWGQVAVLDDQPKIVRLSNESLIPAKFTAHMVRPNSMWRVEPDSGEIAPEDQMELTVTACADDCVRFQDKIQINFLDGPSRTIPVTAYGHGTTVVTDPPMSPVLNLGPHFSKGPCKRTFTLTNSGRRHQSLVWSTEGFGFKQVRSKKPGALQPINPKDMKYKDTPLPPEAARPVFKLTPHRMELNPGESIDVLLEGCVNDPRIVQERLLCHAIIGRAGGKELIMKVQINCEFISPLLQFSSDQLHFRVDKLPDDPLCVQSEEVELTNISSLPLTTCLNLKYPFMMVNDQNENTQEQELYLGIGETRGIRVQFDPAYRDDAHIRIAEDDLLISYKEHPHMDAVTLKGEVYFPNVEFEKSTIDFGCILNDTEVTRYVNMTNNSPMDVRYKWSFLLDDEPVVKFNRPPPSPIEEEPLELQELEDQHLEAHEEDEESRCEDREEPQRADSMAHTPGTEELPVMVEVEPATATPSGMSQYIPSIHQPEDQLAGEDGNEEEEEAVSPDHEEPVPSPVQVESQPPTARSLPSINPTLAALLHDDDPQNDDLGVEEVFDILPLYGTLKPGETEQMTLTFYGHAHIGSKAKAICEVEGGPTYEIILQGEASLVQYRFDCLDIDYGKIMYDQTGVAEITVLNTGRVGFEFVAVGMDPGMASKPKPGMPVMIPHAGFIEADSQQTLTIKFLPGIPEKFHKSFQIQVAHFEPDTVNLLGEGVFPRISLDLPRSMEQEGQYEELVKEVREKLTTETKKTITRPMSAVSQQGEAHHVALQDQAPSDLEVQLEVERVVVQEFAEDVHDQNNVPDVLSVHAEGAPVSTASSRGKRKKTPKPRARLPPYVLDFGHVVLGTVRTHIVRATNTGWFPVSFSVNRDYLYQYGFNIELDRVRQLPGAPDHETVDFEVSFDPRGANLGLGKVATVVPMNIVGGPQVVIQLCANVTMPDMQISTDVLDFSDVTCGQCKVITVQLYNHQHVPCEWNSIPSEKDRVKYEKHVPMHLRRKVRQDKPKPRTYEMMPPYGMLSPGHRQNVQVKFMPTEEKSYEQRISIRLAQSSQRIILLCRGQGLEPHIEFERSLVEFGPVLPHSSGDEQDIKIKNPCKFPVEVYNLEFDKAYLEEEKILRLMKGYDEYNTILLPPRTPAEKLPQELLDYFEEQMHKLEEQERTRRAAEEALEAENAKYTDQSETKSELEKTETDSTTKISHDATEHQDGAKTDRSDFTKDDKTLEGSKKESEIEVKEKDSSSTVGELEITPVSQAIARHLGIDLSPEGKAARNRRGIAVVIHGAPLAGKTTAAVSLAKRYEAALLSVNAIVMEAISNSNSPGGRKARQLCSETAHKLAEEQRALEGDGEVTEKKVTTGGLSVEAVAAHTQGTGQVVTAQSVAHSIVSNRKTSTISDPKSKENKHHGSTVGGKTAVAVSSHEINSQVPSSPPPLVAPVARRLSISASVAGDDGLVSCVLPDELLTEILAERLMLNDCHRGVVFDSLDTLFSQNYTTTANCILKALNNRKYLYFITLKLDYSIMKEQEKARQEEEEKANIEAEECERRRLEDMSEDEYDALEDEDKATVDRKRLEIKKERLRREMDERLERERREKEEAEAEAIRQAEEKQAKKKNKRGPDPKDAKKGPTNKASDTGRVQALKSQDGKKAHESDHAVNKSASGAERPDSHATDRDTSAAEDGKKRKEKSKDGKRPISNEDRKGKGDKSATQDGEEEPQKESKSEEELLLMQRFRTFEHSFKEIENLVDHWERSTGMLRPGTPSDGGQDVSEEIHVHPPSGRKTKKEKDQKKGGTKEKDMLLQAPSAEMQPVEGSDAQPEAPPVMSEEEKREKRLEEGIGIPNIILDCGSREENKPQHQLIVDSGKLPSVEEVLDGLGLGPRGPPIPPPAEFGVVPYPVKRHAPPGAESGHYMFVAASPEDPNIGSIEEKPREEDAEDDKSITPDGRKDDHTTPTRKKPKDAKLAADPKKDRGRQSSARSRAGRRSSTITSSPPPGHGAPTPVSETDGSTTDTALFDSKTPRLTQFRWVIPAEGEITLRLRFWSEDLGQFDQTLNFEIMGTRRRYQLYCRGICAFPTISREPRIVFPHRKKNKKADEIVHKKYILLSEMFDFGPLLVGKSRDRYKEGKYPENMEKLTILNTSPLEADMSFCFLNDSKAETYLLDPPTMQLMPGQSQDLLIWAYPKVPGTYEDALVCCVKENPEPIIFKLISYGVRPELELDKKILQFDKVLLHRKDTKTLYLRNSTLLPVAWRLNGLENLGDDFSVSQESGVIDPKSEFALHAYFRAMKPVNTNRKAVRLEVSDVDNIMGLVQTENIQVHAEAYDVALDMSFPKGADGGIDFDVIRVSDRHAQTCSLKNKGKYEIAYQFLFEPTEQCPLEYCNMFTISQAQGTLSPTDRPSQVAVSFQSDQEVHIKDQPILRCQVIEPSLSDSGETIASIPIKLSVRSVFSKYNIYPVNDINFASMVVGHKKMRVFILENKGDRFEFKYTITKMLKKEEPKQEDRRSRPAARVKDNRSKSRDGSSSGRSGNRPKRTESNRPEAGGVAQSRLILGMYNIYPAVGTIFPGGHQQITVECLAENPGHYEEELAIDVSGRDPNDHTNGIPYRLIAEACIPGIDITNIGSIFEEHHICKNLSVWQHNHAMENGGVYGEDENRFIFNNVLVGGKSKARFKISNNNKVPCVVNFSVKLPVTKHSLKNQHDVFEVEPQKSEIAARSYIYATVTFSPPSMQHFMAHFEAAVDAGLQNQVKSRNLMFEVTGEGNLPRISIIKPIVRNKKGQPLLLFKRNLVGKQQILPLNLINDGTLPSKVDIDLIDPDMAFTLIPIGNTQAVQTLSGIDDSRRKPHTASVIVNVGETATFQVIFCPSVAQRSQGSIHMTVVNNQYEDSVVQLVGEGYEDDISLDNLHSVMIPVDPENEEGCMADDDIPAAKNNHIRFGDCHVTEPRTLSFSMSNHSKTDCVRFEWPEHPQLKFQPQMGHIHAGLSKDMTVTFSSDTPQTLEEFPINCKVVKITFDKPAQEVADWDDRVKTVKWVDVPIQPPTAPSVDGSVKDKPATPVPLLTAHSAKKKVVETEPEPQHTPVQDSQRSLELVISALADYCKYKCKVEKIHFKDTLMLQTRIFKFQLANKGQVTMDYGVQFVSETFPLPPGPRSVTFKPEEFRPPTAAGLVVPRTKIRPGSAESSITSDSSYIPFTVEPENGKVLPGKSAAITVKFSPLDINEFEGRLICSIPNLEEGKQGPVIAILGRSLLPYCHFELEDSDYVRNARRNPELRGPKGAPPGTTLDPNTRVIEFNTVGVDVKQALRFSIVNPTSQHYSFQWENEDETNHKKETDFKCLMSSGTIKSGKKAEVGFEFHSSSLELVESFWKFVIPEQDISVPFLLVGKTIEPNITLERSHMNFRSLLIGHEAEEVVHMSNSEDQGFHYAFEESSLFCAGYSAGLMVEPITGVIPAKSKIPIRIRFTPNSDKEVNFNLICNIKKKTMPLNLNVKAEGYTMNCLVLCEETGGGKQELKSDALNHIRFGDVEVNEKSVRNISIINCGKFNFDYSWELEERMCSGDHMVSITPLGGGVMHGERKICQLSFCPTRATNLRACQLLLKISNGPMYELQVFGNGVLPGLHFSFPSHNFGPCFIHRAGMPVNSTLLKITNTDRKEISVECLYQSTSHLHHDFEAQVIPTGQSVDVNMTFYPREARKYKESVVFEVNGLSKRGVDFLGLGTEMKIEVADPKQKILKLGAMRIGQTIKKIVPIVNKSPAPIEFHLAITPSSHALQENYVLKLSPTSKIQLPPNGGQTKVEIAFAPKTRIPQFTEEVLLECAGLHQPLFVVQGSCQGIEISLDSDAIPFGAVVKKSSSSRNVIMNNTGDIGAKIRWDVKKFGPDFSITPQEGYISPGMEIPFEIIFHPQDVNSDIRYDNLKCIVEGAKPLKLTLTGTCVEVPPSRDAVHFTTHVRHKETKNVLVQNRTNMHCSVRPVIDGEFWTGADTFTMDPSSTKTYEVSYKPLTMTFDNKKHQGTIFFPFPDGTGQMFTLTGTSEAPKAATKINKEIPCKIQYSELLPVHNWLKKPQRFRVKTEMIRPDKLDPGTTIKGLDYIDVPGNSRRDYKLTFYAHKEGQSQFKTMFINDQSQEYQFFEITYKATRPGTITTIELTTPVRQSVPYTITLENPLSYQVAFTVSCNITEIQMPSQLHVSAQNEGQFNFEYLPLKVGDVQGRIELNCNDLGLYTYDLVLKATPAGPERALYFRAGLGTSQVHVAKFLNFAKQKTDYACLVQKPKAESTHFIVDKTVVAAPGSSSGTEVALEVTYEPSHIGESRDILTISSPVGGEYTFPLFGTCIAPKPQGPFSIRAGTTTSISFRNVFASTTGFSFQVDNPLFHVTKPGENIRPHKDHRIVVGFDGNDSGSKASVMGKLIISCAKSAGGATSAQWVYYLKGTTPEK